MSVSKNTFIPKSLHTITAIANLARHLADGDWTAIDCVPKATLILVGAGKSDIYGLQAAAIKALAKEAPGEPEEKGAVARAVHVMRAARDGIN